MTLCKTCGHEIIKRKPHGKAVFFHKEFPDNYISSGIKCKCGCTNPEPKEASK